MENLDMGEAWKTNVKTLFDVFLQDWQARAVADRELRAKLESMFLGKTQDLDAVKLEAARSGQVTNAVVNAALVESVLGRAIAEQTIESKLAAQFPASVTEMVTAFTDKFMSMIGADALLAIINALVQGEAE